MVCIWIDRRVSGRVSKICGWMDGFIDQRIDGWMEIRCHSDEGGGAQEIIAMICPAEEYNSKVHQGRSRCLHPLSIKENIIMRI